ncbi:alkaline phosphatase [Nostocoides sp. F2B08]|nr:alkaline phosphatase [Tetrasphaera sp. F2B08]
MAGAAATAVCASSLLGGASALASPSNPSIELSLAGTYATGVFDASAAEIPAFDVSTDALFVVNAQSGQVDVLDLGSDGVPSYRESLVAAGRLAADGSAVDAGAVVNSVAVSDGLLAVAVEAGDKVQRGWVLFFAADGLGYLGGVRAGSLPDAVALAPNGGYAVVANEGEPADDFGSDPEGSISVISLPRSLQQFSRLTQDSVRTVDFRAYDSGMPLPDGVRVFGPDVPVPDGQEPAGRIARNLEPEYVTIDATGRTAYMSIQEANAVAVVDIRSATLTDLWALELTDWSTDGVLDPSDRDGGITLGNWPVFGVRMPDGLATYRFRGEDLVVSANEGDSREWGDFVDTERAGDLELCDGVFPSDIQANANLGRLDVLTDLGLDEVAGCYSELYALGGRSFSIHTASGEQVFDSAGLFEETVADLISAGELPEEAFNAGHDEQPSFESRSDAKGVEPEGVTIGSIQGRTYAFVGLERIGGVMVFDITDPTRSSFVDYVNNRDFTVDFDGDETDDWKAAGDLGAEGLEFIAKSDSPTGRPLLVVANEVSGTTSVFEITATRGR